jgi:hypothetical protein
VGAAFLIVVELFVGPRLAIGLFVKPVMFANDIGVSEKEQEILRLRSVLFTSGLLVRVHLASNAGDA